MVPSFEERILGIGRLADQRRASSRAKRSTSLFILADDVSDKELEGCGEGAKKRGGYEDAAQRDMAFLPLCEHVNTDLQSKKNAFTHPGTLSLAFSLFSWTQLQSNTQEKMSGSVPLLSGRRP